jgi:hypothetical protein
MFDVISVSCHDTDARSGHASVISLQIGAACRHLH